MIEEGKVIEYKDDNTTFEECRKIKVGLPNKQQIEGEQCKKCIKHLDKTGKLKCNNTFYYRGKYYESICPNFESEQ